MKVMLKTSLSKDQRGAAICAGFSFSHIYFVEYEKFLDGVLCYKLVGGYIYLADYFEELTE